MDDWETALSVLAIAILEAAWYWGQNGIDPSFNIDVGGIIQVDGASGS